MRHQVTQHLKAKSVPGLDINHQVRLNRPSEWQRKLHLGDGWDINIQVQQTIQSGKKTHLGDDKFCRVTSSSQ
jgi:hypothetical protein